MKEKELEKILKAFANRRRLAIVRLLKKEENISVGDIADKIKLSFKATSKHLSVLVSANIIDREQRGLRAGYSLAHDMTEIARRILSVL